MDFKCFCWFCFCFFQRQLIFLKSMYLGCPGLSCGMWDLHCGMRTLSCGMHVGFSFPTRGRTRAPCIGSAESYPLDHQGSPWILNVRKAWQES